MVIGCHVAFVIDFDQHIAEPLFQDPPRCVLGGCDHGCFVFETLVLAEIEVAEDHNHPQLIGFLDHLLHAISVIGPEFAVSVNAELCHGWDFEYPCGLPP